MGGHGDHHEPPFRVPDWRVMKIENIGPLMDIQRALAAKGLKDPWLRNHVWRFPPEIPQNHFHRIVHNTTQGMKIGLFLFAGSLVVEYTYKFFNPPSHDHHGHH